MAVEARDQTSDSKGFVEHITGLILYTYSQWTLRAFSVVIFLVGWQIVSDGVFFIAPPTEIVSVMYDQLFVSGELTGALLQALRLALWGYALAVLIAIPLGAVMGISVHVRNALDPLVDAFYSAPLIAFVPMLIIIFGLSRLAKIILVFMMAFFIILVNVQSGFDEIPDEYVDAGRVFGADTLDLYSKVYLRAAFPQVLTGLRLGSARAVRGMVVAELFVFSQEQIGRAHV